MEINCNNLNKVPLISTFNTKEYVVGGFRATRKKVSDKWYIEPNGWELVCLTSKIRVRIPYVPHGTVAQMVSSRWSEKPKIGGSSPLCSTKF